MSAKTLFVISIIMVILGIGWIVTEGIFFTILGVIVGGIGAIWAFRLFFGI